MNRIHGSVWWPDAKGWSRRQDGHGPLIMQILWNQDWVHDIWFEVHCSTIKEA